MPKITRAHKVIRGSSAVDRVYKGDVRLWPYDWSALSLYVNTVGAAGSAVGTALTGQTENIWQAGWEKKGTGYAGLSTTYARSAWSSNAATASWDCDVTVDTQPTWGSYILIAASVAPNYAYYFELRYGRVQLFKRDGATFFWTTNQTVDNVVVDGDTIGVRMVVNGTDLEVSALHNGVPMLTMVDTTPLVPTYVEINSDDPGGLVRYSNVRAGNNGTLLRW